MNENNEQVVKQKSNKGVIILLVVIIIILLGLSGYLAYDKFIAKDTKTSTNNTTKKEETKTTDDNIIKEETKTDSTTLEIKKDNVAITDKSAFIVKGSSIGGSFIYCYIQDGNLYYYGVNAPEYKTDILFGASYSDNDNNYSPKKYEGLNNVKRIKVFNEGTGIAPYLYLITDDGKVYTNTTLSTYEDIGFEQVNNLKDYQIDDLLDYSMGDSPEADYKVILKDGTTKDIHVTY